MPCPDCTPCNNPQNQQESVASQIQNLTQDLFGPFTKEIVNGVATWGPLCSPDDQGLPSFPRNPGEGFICYLIRLYTYLSTQIITPVIPTFTQVAHGFVVGQPLRYNGASWVKSQADVPANSEVFGLVLSVPDADTFTLISTGSVITGLIGLNPGQVYYLDAAAPGVLVDVEPVAVGTVSKPVMLAITPGSAIVQILRGKLN